MGVIGLRARSVRTELVRANRLTNMSYDGKERFVIEAPLLHVLLLYGDLEATATAAISTTKATTAATTAACTGFLWFGLIDSQRASVHL
jgi:hypothetical protein